MQGGREFGGPGSYARPLLTGRAGVRAGDPGIPIAVERRAAGGKAGARTQGRSRLALSVQLRSQGRLARRPYPRVLGCYEVIGSLTR